MQLRPYQADAITAICDYWRGGGSHPLVAMATGCGKSLVNAKLCDDLTSNYPNFRFVSVTHVEELVDQNYKEFLNLNPMANAGVYHAGLGHRDLHSPIVFGGIQSLHRRVNDLGHVDCLSVDEAHLIPRKQNTMYGRFISRLLEINPDMRVVGLTATPYRIDSGRLDEGDYRLFDRVVYSYDIGDGIRDGYLSRLVSKGTGTHFDLSGVARRGGDFIAEALQAACDKEEVTRAAVAEIVAAGVNRRSWLCFCAGVEHAYHVRDEIRSYGITCETIVGDTSNRAEIIAAYKCGEIRCLTNNSVLTTGFNAPAVDLIAGLRPTLSTGLYVQIAGRGTRLCEGKENCLYLDFAGNVRRHGPVDDVQPKKPGKGDGEAPIKECPNCHTLVHISAKECPECGHPFLINEEAKHDATASDAPILKIDAQKPIWQAVTGRAFHRHIAGSGNETVRADFVSGFTTYKHWLFPSRWRSFWEKHEGQQPVPETIADFLARQSELCPSLEIATRKKGKYWEVLNVKPDRSQMDGAA